MFKFRSKDSSHQQLSSFLKKTFSVRPKSIGLYKDALRHKSVAREKKKNDNERLEFLGDAVLDIIIAEQVFHLYPDKTEGELTQLKARIVSRKTLGVIGVKIGLGDVVDFVDGKYVNKNTICGNAFEALVGAIYIDRGFDMAKRAVRFVLSNNLDLDKIAENDPDYKSQILVWSQKQKQPITFIQTKVQDLGHEKIYHFEIRSEDKVLGKGTGKSKKTAEQEASKNALVLVQSF